MKTVQLLAAFAMALVSTLSAQETSQFQIKRDEDSPNFFKKVISGDINAEAQIQVNDIEQDFGPFSIRAKLYGYEYGVPTLLHTTSPQTVAEGQSANFAMLGSNSKEHSSYEVTFEFYLPYEQAWTPITNEFLAPAATSRPEAFEFYPNGLWSWTEESGGVDSAYIWAAGVSPLDPDNVNYYVEYRHLDINFDYFDMGSASFFGTNDTTSVGRYHKMPVDLSGFGEHDTLGVECRVYYLDGAQRNYVTDWHSISINR